MGCLSHSSPLPGLAASSPLLVLPEAILDKAKAGDTSIIPWTKASPGRIDAQSEATGDTLLMTAAAHGQVL